MIRRCPNCPPNRRHKLRVTSIWVRQDGVIGRALKCAECDYEARSYEVVTADPRRLRSLDPGNAQQLFLVTA